uniref:Uncharacterized protein n=1 Tax=Anguilla anguilla TaxID=7936 RepID=A0A0E9U8P1_ANGAN
MKERNCRERMVRNSRKQKAIPARMNGNTPNNIRRTVYNFTVVQYYKTVLLAHVRPSSNEPKWEVSSCVNQDETSKLQPQN